MMYQTPEYMKTLRIARRDFAIQNPPATKEDCRFAVTSVLGLFGSTGAMFAYVGWQWFKVLTA